MRSGALFPGRARRAVLAVIVLLAVAAVTVAPARATWSIVAVDPATGQVGGTIASCVDLPSRYYDDDGVLENLVLVPGVGAAVTQALVNLGAADRIGDDLAAGATAAEVIDGVTDAGFDADAARRQHGVVRLDAPDAPAAFTGAGTDGWAGHQTAGGVSVQGNILASADVVAETLAAFRRSGGEALGDRLVDGLVAGARAGGDSRCPEQKALFAQVAVADPNGALDVRTARVDEGDGRNPVVLLAAGELSGPPGSSTAGITWWDVAVGLALGLGVVATLASLTKRRRSRRAA